MRQLRYLYIKRPAQKRRETVEDIDFRKEFPQVLNADAGEISLVGCNSPRTRKPINGRPAVKPMTESVPLFGTKFDCISFGVLVGAAMFSGIMNAIGMI